MYNEVIPFIYRHPTNSNESELTFENSINTNIFIRYWGIYPSHALRFIIFFFPLLHNSLSLSFSLFSYSKRICQFKYRNRTQHTRVEIKITDFKIQSIELNSGPIKWKISVFVFLT